MGSAFGAGAGADMLQEVLRRKFTEALAQQQMKLAQQRLTDENTRFHSGQVFQAGENQKGRDFTHGESEAARTFTHGENEAGRTFTAGENDKGRTFTHGENEAGRTFTAGENLLGRGFTAAQNDANRSNAVRIAGINGANALRVAQNNHPGTGAATAQQQNEVDDAIALIDQIENDPSLAASTGPLDSRGLGMATDTTGVTRVNALHNQLVGKMALAQAGKLKGQGQISDKERALLRDAATALTQHMGDADYRKELTKLRGQFERMRGGPAFAAAPAAEFDFVLGKGLVPRGQK